MSVMRTLQIGDRPAVAEAGRIDKTIHCLTYIDDETNTRRFQRKAKSILRFSFVRAPCGSTVQLAVFRNSNIDTVHSTQLTALLVKPRPLLTSTQAHKVDALKKSCPAFALMG